MLDLNIVREEEELCVARNFNNFKDIILVYYQLPQA